MEQEDEKTSLSGSDTLKSWNEQTRDLVENLLTRLTAKEKQLNDREEQLSFEKNCLEKLRNEVG